jgi:hypothetical protein
MGKNAPARRQETFDLTTEAGRERALEFFDRWGWAIWPLGWTLRTFFLSTTQGELATLEAQKKAAIDLIKAGKNQDIDAMKITLDQIVGLDLGTEVEGVPIKAKIGKSGHMTVEAKYKS